MTNVARAKYDQAVIDAWQVSLKRHHRKSRKLGLFLAIAFGAAVLALRVVSNPFPPLVAMWIALLVVPALVFRRAPLLCPHCHRQPDPCGKSAVMDFCGHCHYWLISPYTRPEAAQKHLSGDGKP